MSPDDRLRLLLAALDGSAATDLHLKPGSPPKVRRHGSLDVVAGEPALGAGDVDELVRAALPDGALRALAANGETSATLSASGLGRFRVRAQRQRGSTLLLLRRIPDRVPSMVELGLPDAVTAMTEADRGIVLVGGPARSGRRTTLASMLDHVNRSRALHLVAVERPVEVLHRDVLASVSQLEVGFDTPTFAFGVRAAIAADGDVVFVSDVDDDGTVEAILEAVEDGALVLAGMDGDGAASLVDRFVDLLPPARRESARIALAGALVGTVSQRLAPRASGTGRVPVVEVVRATPRVREALLDGDTVGAVPGLAEIGFADAVAELFGRGVIDLRGALAVTDDWPALHEAMAARGLITGVGAPAQLVAPPPVPAPEVAGPVVGHDPLPPLPRRVPGAQLPGPPSPLTGR